MLRTIPTAGNLKHLQVVWFHRLSKESTLPQMFKNKVRLLPKSMPDPKIVTNEECFSHGRRTVRGHSPQMDSTLSSNLCFLRYLFPTVSKNKIN